MGKKKTPFESIKQGLIESIEYANGDLKKAKTHKIPRVEVKSIRQRIGMTQPEFAAAFHISLATLRHWERGDRLPQGPALVLLNLVARKPQTIRNILSDNLAA